MITTIASVKGDNRRKWEVGEERRGRNGRKIGKVRKQKKERGDNKMKEKAVEQTTSRESMHEVVSSLVLQIRTHTNC